MSTLTDPPKPAFRLSQLVYDTRYRSLTIQVVAMIGLMALFVSIYSNTMANLAESGKTFEFGFINRPANYDIGQTLIPYDSVTATHGRAALVGILNTLLVAGLGCIFATIFGVFAGVLRLSNNWLISRLMGVYVEGFRNVPLLLWIIAIYAVVSESLPQPRDFKTGEASMLFGDTVAITNRYLAMPAPVWGQGSGIVMIVFAVSVIGIFLFRRFAAKRQEATGQIMPVLWISLALLIVPTLLAYFVMGRPITLDYPVLGGFNFRGGLQVQAPLLALTLALSLYTGSFIAEIVRGGILAVSKGQSEAASALGMRPNRTMNLVILPQAMRVIIPPLISQFLNLTKNSSLALAVGYPDVRATLGGTTMSITGKELEATILLGAFYLVLSLTISGVLNVVNNRMKLEER